MMQMVPHTASAPSPTAPICPSMPSDDHFVQSNIMLSKTRPKNKKLFRLHGCTVCTAHPLFLTITNSQSLSPLACVFENLGIPISSSHFSHCHSHQIFCRFCINAGATPLVLLCWCQLAHLHSKKSRRPRITIQKKRNNLSHKNRYFHQGG